MLLRSILLIGRAVAEVIAICAQRQSGVDVKRTYRSVAVDAHMGKKAELRYSSSDQNTTFQSRFMLTTVMP